MSAPSFSARFALTHLLLPSAVVLLALTLIAWLDVDHRLLAYFYDPLQANFPLRENWLLEQVIHRGGKNAVVVFWLGLVATYMLRSKNRRLLLFLILSIALATLSVSALKRVTNRHCPYDLFEYGGNVEQAKWLHVANAPAGHCFPGGHASAGFSLMALYFVWYRSNRKRAWIALISAAALGLVFGSARMIQGAHFLSHNLWSGLICWLIAAGLYQFMFLRRRNFSPGRVDLP